MGEVHEFKKTLTFDEMAQSFHERYPAVDGRKFGLPSYKRQLGAALKAHEWEPVSEGLDRYVKWLSEDTTRLAMSPQRFLSEEHYFDEYQSKGYAWERL